MRINVCVESFDRHSTELLSALCSMGMRLSLVLPETSGPDTGSLTPGGPLPSIFEQTLRPGELDAHRAPLLCIPSPALLPHETPCFPAEGWAGLAIAAATPVILDAARLPLSLRGQAIAARWQELFPRLSALLYRDEGQRQMLSGLNPRQTLHLPDYLRHSRAPRSVATDVAWLLRGIPQGGGSLPRLPEAPPSRLVHTLLNARAKDPEATALARSILRIDPLHLPSLLRLYTINQGQNAACTPPILEAAAREDSCAWLHQLAAARHGEVPPPSPKEAYQRPEQDRLFPSVAPGRNGKRRILLIVVYKARDLFIDLLLRHHLEAMGHEVVMRPLNLSTCNSILDVCPDLIIWGARTTPIQRNLSYFAADRNILQVVRREEGNTFEAYWERLQPQQKSLTLGTEDYSPYVDLELGYNATFAKVVATEGHLPSRRVVSVGAMPFDIYFLKGLEKVLPGRKEIFARLGCDPQKRLLLMATPWSYADRDPQTAIPEADRKNPEFLAAAVKTVQYARAGRKAWLDFLARFCAEHASAWNVVVKIHPGERVEEYDEFITAHSLPASTLCGGYMAEVLRHCDLLMHAGSTTSVEAHLIGIPSFAYWVHPTHTYPLYEANQILNSYEEFQEFLNRTPLGKSNMSAADLTSLQDTLYGAIDGQACLRAAMAIDELLKASRRIPFRQPADSWVPHEAYPPVENTMGLHISIDEAEAYAALIRDAMEHGQRHNPG